MYGGLFQRLQAWLTYLKAPMLDSSSPNDKLAQYLTQTFDSATLDMVNPPTQSITQFM